MPSPLLYNVTTLRVPSVVERSRVPLLAAGVTIPNVPLGENSALKSASPRTRLTAIDNSDNAVPSAATQAVPFLVNHCVFSWPTERTPDYKQFMYQQFPLRKSSF